MDCETKRELERMKLKPCPFCGGKAEISGGTVYCPVCEISFANERETGAEAVKEVEELWNERPIENELEAENKRLREALEVILDEAQKDEPCILAIKVVAYTTLKGVSK